MLADHLWFISWHLIIVHWVIYLEKGILGRLSDDSVTSLVIAESFSKRIEMEYILGNQSNGNDKNKNICCHKLPITCSSQGQGQNEAAAAWNLFPIFCPLFLCVFPYSNTFSRIFILPCFKKWSFYSVLPPHFLNTLYHWSFSFLPSFFFTYFFNLFFLCLLFIILFLLSFLYYFWLHFFNKVLMLLFSFLFLNLFNPF